MKKLDEAMMLVTTKLMARWRATLIRVDVSQAS
jgi:hypothetical protein